MVSVDACMLCRYLPPPYHLRIYRRRVVIIDFMEQLLVLLETVESGWSVFG